MYGDFMRKKQKTSGKLIFLLFFFLYVFLQIYPWLIELFIILGILGLIIWIWFMHNKNKIHTYDLSAIDHMAPFDFEEYICKLYIELGYPQSYTTPKSGDYVADVIAKKGSQTTAIQVKHYAPTDKVGVSAVQAIIGAKNYYKTSSAAVVTTSYFTKAAIRMAQRCQVELIDRDALKKILVTLQSTKAKK